MMSTIILLSARLIHSRDHSCHWQHLQHPCFCACKGSPSQPHSSTRAQRVYKQACEVSGMQESISQKQDVASFFLHISLIILF